MFNLRSDFGNCLILFLASCFVFSVSGCKTVGGSKNALQSATATDGTAAKLRYHVTEYQGKVTYKTRAELQTCKLKIYKSNQDGKIAAVKLVGSTRDSEPASFTIGGPVDPDSERLDLKVDFERQPFKDLEGYTRIAHSEETVKKSIAWSGLVVVDIAFLSEHEDYFGTVTGTEIHRMKLIGGLVKDDSSYERETVMCNYVKKFAETESDDLGG